MFNKKPDSLSIAIKNVDCEGDGKMYCSIYLTGGINKCIYSKKTDEDKIDVNLIGGVNGAEGIRVKIKESKFGNNPTRGEWEFSKDEVKSGFNGVKEGDKGAKAHFTIKFNEGQETNEYETQSDSD